MAILWTGVLNDYHISMAEGYTLRVLGGWRGKFAGLGFRVQGREFRVTWLRVN